MNPTFFAFQKAYLTSMTNLMLGIPHVPKPKKSANEGAAFAPGHGVQQLETSEEKEAMVQAHLAQLAAESKARYLDHVAQHPHVEEFPRSDLIVLAEEEQAIRDADAQAEKDTPYGGAPEPHVQELKAKFDKLLSDTRPYDPPEPYEREEKL